MPDYKPHKPDFKTTDGIQLCHIATIRATLLMSKAFEWPFMGLAHLVTDQHYLNAVKQLPSNVYKYMDNSAFELGRAVSVDSLIRAGQLTEAHCLIEPDGLHGGMADRIHEAGFDIMCITKGDSMVQDTLALMRDTDIEFVGIAFNHATDWCLSKGYIEIPTVKGKQNRNDYVHLARPIFMKELLKAAEKDGWGLPFKKLHFLGGTTPGEMVVIRKYSKYICTWDTSMALWSAVNGVSVADLEVKYSRPVDFKNTRMPDMLSTYNVGYLEGILALHDEDDQDAVN